MGLSEDLARIAEVARPYAAPGEALAAIIPVEPAGGVRIYLCAYGDGDGRRSWLALGGEGRPVRDRRLVREAVSIAAMCELAEESAGGGSLEELRARLAELRAAEAPEGIEEAEEAARALEEALGVPPRVASPAYLDRIGAAARELERALGDIGRSPFSEAMARAVGPIDELKLEVEAGYKTALD